MSVYRWTGNILLVSLLVVVAGGVAVAQSVLPPDETLSDKPEKTKWTIQIDSKALELAENYILLLEQLRFLTHDYGRYLTESGTGLNDEYLAAIREISKDLAKGTYYEEITKLDTDLAGLHEKIAEALHTKKEFNVQHEHSERDVNRTRKLISSLASELEVIQQMLDAQVSTESDEYKKHAEEIKLYLEERCREDALKRVKIHEMLPELDELTESLEELEYKFEVDFDPEEPARVIVITDGVPRLMAVPEYIVSAPEVPQPPDVARSVDILYDKGDKGVRYVRVCADSSDEVTTSTPIYVHNPIGDLNIVGWNRDYVRVNSDIVVSAESGDTAEKFAKQINLRLYLKNDRLYVETEIPRLSDPDTRVTGNTVYVRLPRDNPVVCQSSFGKIDITGMRNSVKVKAEYCQVTANDIQGSLVIANSFGEVISTGVEGSVSIKNSNSPIQMKACSGDIEIENTAAPITVLGSDGSITIRNSGQISVIDHRGDATIANEQGPVKIERLEGNLDIVTSMGDINLQNITGYVNAQNAYASISANRIGGKVTASIRSGSMVLNRLNGPLDISNDRGSIDLVFDRSIAGASVINATRGTVMVKFREPLDLTLTATAIEGMIQSSYPVKKITDEPGSGTKLKHTFGKGANSLDIFGRQATIVITKEG
jgi:hypothetical protein